VIILYRSEGSVLSVTTYNKHCDNECAIIIIMYIIINHLIIFCYMCIAFLWRTYFWSSFIKKKSYSQVFSNLYVHFCVIKFSFEHFCYITNLMQKMYIMVIFRVNYVFLLLQTTWIFIAPDFMFLCSWLHVLLLLLITCTFVAPDYMFFGCSDYMYICCSWLHVLWLLLTTCIFGAPDYVYFCCSRLHVFLLHSLWNYSYLIMLFFMYQ